MLSPSTITGYIAIRDNRFQSIAITPLGKIKNWQTLIICYVYLLVIIESILLYPNY